MLLLLFRTAGSCGKDFMYFISNVTFLTQVFRVTPWSVQAMLSAMPKQTNG